MDTRSCQESLLEILGHITYPSYAVAYCQTAFPSLVGSHVAHLGTEAAPTRLFCVAWDIGVYVYFFTWVFFSTFIDTS